MMHPRCAYSVVSCVFFTPTLGPARPMGKEAWTRDPTDRDLPVPVVKHYKDQTTPSSIESDEDMLDLQPLPQQRTGWKSNPFVPVGIFGTAVGAGALMVMARRNSGFSLGQRVMQARVAAQGLAVAGLLAFAAGGIYQSSRVYKGTVAQQHIPH